MSEKLIQQKIQQFKSFEGKPKKITLVTSPCYFLEPPADDDPRTQKLTITEKGQVSFSSLNYSFPPSKISCGEWRKVTIEKAQASELLDKIVEPFREYEIAAYLTDVGTWELTIVNTDDKTFKYSGSLEDGTFHNAKSVSDAIRESLLMNDLFCFDGGCE